MRATQKVNLVAVGHRVVHGGPQYDHPVIVDQDVLARLEQYIFLASFLHQPNNLAPIRSLLACRPELVQVACFDTAFDHTHSAQSPITTRFLNISIAQVSGDTDFTGSG